METEQHQVIAQGVGQALGELLGAFLLVVEALRKQPGFDDDAFRAELAEHLAGEQLTALQRHALTRLVEAE